MLLPEGKFFIVPRASFVKVSMDHRNQRGVLLRKQIDRIECRVTKKLLHVQKFGQQWIVLPSVNDHDALYAAFTRSPKSGSYRIIPVDKNKIWKVCGTPGKVSYGSF
jgi:hypothetical protein